MEINQLRRGITIHVRAYCSLIHDDPQTGERDMCCARNAGHCIAIDNPLYHADKGMSMCKQFNTFPPTLGVQQGAAKVCTVCHR